jgi:nucleoside-diphosphate-sugar epimerase
MIIPFWDRKRVLVTGGTGFVGAHLVKRLRSAGAHVDVMDIRGSGPTSKALGTEFDFRYRDLAASVYQGHVPLYDIYHVVFHLAGQVSVSQCHIHPHLAAQANVLASLQILRWVRDYPDVTFVCASSDRVYGDAKDTTGHYEDDALKPVDVYGATKAASDVLFEQAARAGYKVSQLRHVNSYGPADPHLDHLIPGSIVSAIKGEPIKLRSDGSPKKGYLHVEDVVDAYLILGKDTSLGHARGSFNCSPVNIYSAAQVAFLLSGMVEPQAQVQVLSTDMSQSGYTEYLNSNKLRARGWLPKYGLFDGLQDTLKWYQEHPEFWQ